MDVTKMPTSPVKPRRRIDLRGVFIDDVDMDGAMAAVRAALNEAPAVRRLTRICTPNVEFLNACRHDTKLAELINSADMTVPDGIGVVVASRLIGTPLHAQVRGIDLGERIAAELASRGGALYLLGAKPGVAQRAGERLAEKYQGLRIAGAHDGYFQWDSDGERQIIERINASGANALFVCLGFPRQDTWITAHAAELAPAVAIGLGGSLDVYSGETQSTPRWMINLRLEWFHRLLKQPWRIGRMIKIPRYLLGMAIYGRTRKKITNNR